MQFYISFMFIHLAGSHNKGCGVQGISYLSVTGYRIQIL